MKKSFSPRPLHTPSICNAQAETLTLKQPPAAQSQQQYLTATQQLS